MEGLKDLFEKLVVLIRCSDDQGGLSSFISLSATSTQLRGLVLPMLVGSPYFASPRAMKKFFEWIVPRYAHLVKDLFHLGWREEEGGEAAMGILDACLGTLEGLSLVGVPLAWRAGIVRRLKAGAWGALRSAREDPNELEWGAWIDLLEALPKTLTSLTLFNLSLEDLRTIADYIQSLEAFHFQFVTEDVRSEDYVRGEVKFFLDRNPKLISVSMICEEEVFIVYNDWIFLDECVSRGIALKREGGKGGAVSWGSFQNLPDSVSVENAVKILAECVCCTSWKFCFSDLKVLDPFSLDKKMEVYRLFVNEFGLKELVIKVDDWLDERKVWMDLAICVPCNVSCLVVENLVLEDLRSIADHVQQLEEFQFQFARDDERGDVEEEIRSEVEYFLDQNTLLRRVSHVACEEEMVFGLRDWIFLDGCVSRGISLKRETCKEVVLSWEKFKNLPGSISIQNVVQILAECMHCTSWKFNIRSLKTLDPLSLKQKMEMYLFFVKELGLKELIIKVDEWLDESCFLKLEEFLDENGKNQHIEHLKLDNFSFRGSSNLYKGGFTKFLMGCVALKRISVDEETLRVLRTITLPSIALSVSLRESSSLVGDLIWISTLPSLGDLNWISTPKSILVECASLGYNLNNFDSLQIQEYLSENLWLWNLDCQFTILFVREGWKISNHC